MSFLVLVPCITALFCFLAWLAWLAFNMWVFKRTNDVNIFAKTATVAQSFRWSAASRAGSAIRSAAQRKKPQPKVESSAGP